MGAPYGAADAVPDLAAVAADTRAAFPGMDATPTKTWLVAHGREPQWKWHYDLAFAKRPAEELYDLKNDPDQVKNLAADPAFAGRMKALSARLTGLLTAA